MHQYAGNCIYFFKNSTDGLDLVRTRAGHNPHPTPPHLPQTKLNPPTESHNPPRTSNPGPGHAPFTISKAGF